MPSSRIVLEIPELMLYAGKIMSYEQLRLSFYSASQREFNYNYDSSSQNRIGQEKKSEWSRILVSDGRDKALRIPLLLGIKLLNRF